MNFQTTSNTHNPLTASFTDGGLRYVETLVNGKPKRIECIDIIGQKYARRRGLVNLIELEDDWYEDVADPQKTLAAIRSNSGLAADIFTFWQRPPDTVPLYPFYFEPVDTAVLQISTFEHWWEHQIKPRVRNLIRKSQKDGLVVRVTTYNDDFVRGMTAIFNESPVRQGRKFWHYGKDFQTVKSQFSRFISREVMIGAYIGDELIGLIMLGKAGQFGLTGQIISSLKHRDKFPNNALIAKAVEVCAEQRIPSLCYLHWGNDSLTEFKRRCGFEKVTVPRYYIPLTLKGEIALRLGLHRGLIASLPVALKSTLKAVRNRWNSRLTPIE